MTESHLPGTETSQGPDYLYIASRLAAPLFLLLLVVVFALLEPNFLNPFNLLNILRQVSFTGLIAVGMTFVILTAGIDLSVGSLLALAGMVGAFVAKGGLADRFAVGAGCRRGQSLAAGAPRRAGRRYRCWCRAGLHHRQAQGPTLRGDARRTDGLPRHDADALRRRAHLRLRRPTTTSGGRVASTSSSSRTSRSRRSSSSRRP